MHGVADVRLRLYSALFVLLVIPSKAGLLSDHRDRVPVGQVRVVIPSKAGLLSDRVEVMYPPGIDVVIPSKAGLLSDQESGKACLRARRNPLKSGSAF